MSEPPESPQTREVQTAAIAGYREQARLSRFARPLRDSLRDAPWRRQHDTIIDTATRVTTTRSAKRSDRKDKYLVRRYLDLLTSDEDEDENEGGRLAIDNNESFFPTPKITFLIDRPENLTCQICHTTGLEMAPTADAVEDSTPAILPCGHVACYECLETWLDTNDSCPFCRKDMVYEVCGHIVQPIPIAHDTISTLPRTLPEGGLVYSSCHSCRDKTVRNASAKRLRDLAVKFKRARREARDLGTEAAIEAMKEAQKAFEIIPGVNVLDGMIARHTSW
ncbi:hypothetical protein AAE478_001541 [Parahypoxylon ruwenzoriense]